MNNERRGVNCVHTWFLKQEEIKSQLSQWVSLSKDSSGNGKAHFFLPTEKLFLFTLFQKASSPPNGTTLLFFLSPSEKISFSPKKYLFFRKTNIFFRETYILLVFVSILPFLCPPHDLCCNHLFLSNLSPLDGLWDPLPGSSSTCQSPTAASKSEVDSLRPLRMWHVARWDSDAWLKMWSAK